VATNVESLTKETLELLRPFAAKRSVDVAIETAAKELAGPVDAGQLQQVISNLVMNAIQATAAGGHVKLRWYERRAEPPPDVGGAEGTYLCLDVADDGEGIRPENLPRVFEPFFTTKEPGKGTGLGLSTVYGIVSQHRGAVFVQSVPKHGSRFEVWLPATAAHARSPGPVARASALPLKRPQDAVILLVEDDTHVRALTRKVLEREGYQVCEATHGPEALRVWSARAGQIDLLLTDMVMPGGMNGIALASELRKQRANLPVVFMSGYSPEVAGRELSESERRHLIEKPASPRAILQAVQNALAAPSMSMTALDAR